MPEIKKELGDLNGTVYVLKFLKEFNTTSGRIGGGRYQGYAGSKDWFDSFNDKSTLIKPIIFTTFGGFNCCN